MLGCKDDMGDRTAYHVQRQEEDAEDEGDDDEEHLEARGVLGVGFSGLVGDFNVFFISHGGIVRIVRRSGFRLFLDGAHWRTSEG